MEVVGGIASVGNILGGTITTAKFFYKSLQSIRHAPDNFADLDSAVCNFVELLEKYEKEITKVRLESAIDCTSLESFLVKCKGNFEQWQKEVETHQKGGSEGKMSELVWRGRVGLKTGRIKQILATLNENITALNSYYAFIQR